MRRILPAVACLAVVATVNGAALGPGEGTLAVVAAALPAEVAGLRAEGRDEVYEGRAIFTYLDGGAEVYLAYGMRACLARRYVGKGLTVVADLFDMGSPKDAFGVFTHDTDGEPVDLGYGASLRPGWLSLWKGHFFLSLTADADDAAAQRALLELGRAAAAAIPYEPPVPLFPVPLPEEGLEERSVRFLHDHLLLAAHLVLPGDNLLGLGRDTDVLLARYRRGGEGAMLLLVEYPNAERAVTANGAVWRAMILPSQIDVGCQAAPPGSARRCSTVRVDGARLALVTASSSPELARALAREALAAYHPTGPAAGEKP